MTQSAQASREFNCKARAAEPRSGLLIQLENLWKIYEMGTVQVTALRDFSLQITEGELVAIMGASGSGKSTLLNILGCLDRPTKGKYLLGGVDVSTYTAALRADVRSERIGFIFQNFNLLPRASVWENVEAPMLYAGVRKLERDRRVEHALEVVRIPEKARALPNQLSGGEQQRVAIARALVNRPSIILADEPTGNLDSKTSEEILSFLRGLNEKEGMTLLVVTHDLETAAYASRLIVLKDGVIERDQAEIGSRGFESPANSKTVFGEQR